MKLSKPFRNLLKTLLFAFLRKLLSHEETKELLTSSLKGLLYDRVPTVSVKNNFLGSIYRELERNGTEQKPNNRVRPIFITARFRSGSTLLWHIFRNIESCTAYYEPLCERRWFDPVFRQDKVDSTHKGVDEYWWEYNGLKLLTQYYREEWCGKNLYMDSRSWDPGMKRYVEVLIEKSAGRPVLQFNRINFRLPWFRKTFPTATIVHLYRHPREAWCSSLLDLSSFPKDGKVSSFISHDHFYLLRWARDLKYHFPFLDEEFVSHPYQLFYFIWRLSYAFGREYADYSLCFEDLVEDPNGELSELFKFLGIEDYEQQKLSSLIVKPAMGKWRKYANDEWFRQHEVFCEEVLAEFLDVGQGKSELGLENNDGELKPAWFEGRSPRGVGQGRGLM